jgi:hypothetical protein
LHDPGRGFLDPDPSARLDYLRALTIQSPPDLPRDRIAQALGAEIVGLAVMPDAQPRALDPRTQIGAGATMRSSALGGC